MHRGLKRALCVIGCALATTTTPESSDAQEVNCDAVTSR